MTRKPAAESRCLRRMYHETLPEMGVNQMVGTGQSESLSGSDASGGGGGGGGLGIYNGFSFNASRVILISGEVTHWE